MREFIQHFSHLVASFATANVDHKLCVRVLCKGLLCDRLSRSEWPWDTGCSTLSEWEQEIQNSHTGDKRCVRCVLLLERSWSSDGPLLHHLHLCAVFKDTHRLCDIEISGFNRFHSTAGGWRNHDLVNDCVCFLDVPNNLTANHFIANSDLRFEGPDLFEVEGICIDTTGDEHTHFFLQCWERALDTIINLGQKSRSE